MTTHYHKTITPADLRRNGKTVTINRITSAVRDHLQLLFGPLSPVGAITIQISAAPLTDSAGSPLMTREDRGPQEGGAGGEYPGAGNG